MADQAEEKVHGYRWVILGVLWITYIVVFLNRLSVGPLAPFFKDDLGITSTQVGLIMSAASLGYMVSILPMGWVVDRIGARWPMVTGELIAGACMMALFFATSYPWLLILMFVTGLGCGFLLPSTTQGVIAWFPLRERATVMGLKQTAVNIGGIISASTLPAIALALGWQELLLLRGEARGLHLEPRIHARAQLDGGVALHGHLHLQVLVRMVRVERDGHLEIYRDRHGIAERHVTQGPHDEDELPADDRVLPSLLLRDGLELQLRRRGRGDDVVA